jgi:hypothetical protein
MSGFRRPRASMARPRLCRRRPDTIRTSLMRHVTTVSAPAHHRLVSSSSARRVPTTSALTRPAIRRPATATRPTSRQAHRARIRTVTTARRQGATGQGPVTRATSSWATAHRVRTRMATSVRRQGAMGQAPAIKATTLSSALRRRTRSVTMARPATPKRVSVRTTSCRRAPHARIRTAMSVRMQGATGPGSATRATTPRQPARPARIRTATTHTRGGQHAVSGYGRQRLHDGRVRRGRSL